MEPSKGPSDSAWRSPRSTETPRAALRTRGRSLQSVGNAAVSEEAVPLLSRLLPLLRCALPRGGLVRLDAGFATPEVFERRCYAPSQVHPAVRPRSPRLATHSSVVTTPAWPRRAGASGGAARWKPESHPG